MSGFRPLQNEPLPCPSPNAGMSDGEPSSHVEEMFPDQAETQAQGTVAESALAQINPCQDLDSGSHQTPNHSHIPDSYHGRVYQDHLQRNREWREHGSEGHSIQQYQQGTSTTSLQQPPQSFVHSYPQAPSGMFHAQRNLILHHQSQHQHLSQQVAEDTARHEASLCRLQQQQADEQQQRPMIDGFEARQQHWSQEMLEQDYARRTHDRQWELPMHHQQQQQQGQYHPQYQNEPAPIQQSKPPDHGDSDHEDRALHGLTHLDMQSEARRIRIRTAGDDPTRMLSRNGMPAAGNNILVEAARRAEVAVLERDMADVLL